MSYCECQYERGIDLFCDTVSVCTNVPGLCCVVLLVPEQCGGDTFCDTVGACTNVAVFIYVILCVVFLIVYVPVKMLHFF